MANGGLWGRDDPPPEKHPDEVVADSFWREVYDIAKAAVGKYIRDEGWCELVAGEIQNQLRYGHKLKFKELDQRKQQAAIKRIAEEAQRLKLNE